MHVLWYVPLCNVPQSSPLPCKYNTVHPPQSLNLQLTTITAKASPPSNVSKLVQIEESEDHIWKWPYECGSIKPFPWFEYSMGDQCINEYIMTALAEYGPSTAFNRDGTPVASGS